MALADGGHEGALEADLVLVDRVYDLLRDAELAVGTLDWSDVHDLPLDRDLEHDTGSRK